YGYFETIFALQIHFFSKDVLLSDLINSLSSDVGRNAEKYLLNIAAKSCDFFDYTLLSEVNKTVVTALWTKDDRVKVENHGFMFNELGTATGIAQYATDGITSFLINNPVLRDLSDKINIDGKKQDSVPTVDISSQFINREESLDSPINVNGVGADLDINQ